MAELLDLSHFYQYDFDVSQHKHSFKKIKNDIKYFNYRNYTLELKIFLYDRIIYMFLSCHGTFIKQLGKSKNKLHKLPI